MATGDNTAYLRSKIATRRGRTDYGGEGGEWSSHPQFMKDGYVKWAESTRPAREGGVEKIPAEKQMPRRGKGIIEDFIPLAPSPLKEMGEFYLKAKEYTPRIKEVLRDKKIQNSIQNGKYADKMEQIAKYMEMVGLGHMTEDESMCRRVGGSKSFKDWAKEEMGEESHGGRIGMGKHQSMEEHVEECLKGGMSLEQTLESLKKKGKAVYDWLKANKALTSAVLKSKYLNEDLGTDIPRKVKGMMEKVGLGKDEMEGGVSFASMKKGLTQAHEFGKKHGSTMKALAREYGGEYGRAAADIAEKAGYGKGGRLYSTVGNDIAKKHASKFEALRGPTGKGGRKPSAYAMFVKEYAKKHPGPDLMKRAAAAYRQMK